MNQGKPPVVVITGASAGVGRATAREFARLGAHIGLLARGEERLSDTAREVEELGGRAVAISTDVAKFKQVEAAASKVEQVFGPIDIWINNAMVTIFSPVSKITPEEYKRATEVTYLGTVYGTMSALKRMKQRDQGTIVQVGSALSYRAIPLQSAYCGAKYAIRGFTDSLRTELMHEKSKIHLTMVQLPALNTPQFSWARTHVQKHPQPVPPIFDPQVAAQAIVFAGFNKRREVWVGKPAVAIMILNRLFPSLIDKYLALTGYKSQKLNREVSENRKDNLFTPAPGNWAARGIFRDRSKAKSLQFKFEKIPVVHYITNIFFSIVQMFLLLPKFLKNLINANRSI